MRIDNKTNWQTRHIHAIAQKVAEDELDGPHRRRLVIHVVEAKRGNSVSLGKRSAIGWARYGTRQEPHPEITIVMPKGPTVQRTARRFVAAGQPWELRRERIPAGGNADPVTLAQTIAHELAHTRGLTHAQMRGHRRYNNALGSRDYYAWAAEMPLELKPSASSCTSSADVIKRRSQHAASMLRKAETRMKRAATIVKKWRARARYYERRLAAQRPGHLSDRDTNSE